MRPDFRVYIPFTCENGQLRTYQYRWAQQQNSARQSSVVANGARLKIGSSCEQHRTLEIVGGLRLLFYRDIWIGARAIFRRCTSIVHLYEQQVFALFFLCLDCSK